MGTDEQLRDAQEQPDSEPNCSNQSMDEGQNRDTETESTQVSATDTKVDNSIDPTTAEPALDTPKASKNSRKRTKTGCLTCRRRRIKCGEERPICNNCIKSKRNCEGYNHRSVLKEGGNNGQFGVPPEVSPDLHSPSYPFHHPSASYRPHGQSLYDVQMPPNATSLTPLAPRPPFTHNQIFPYEAHGLPQQPVYGIQQSRQSLDTPITPDMPSNLPDSGSHSHLYMQQAYGGQIDVAKAYDGLPGSGVPLPFMGNEGHHQYEASIAHGSSNVTSYEQNMTNFRQDSMTTFIPPMSSISDSQTAQLFRYFITVSAPILSAFERHTLEPSSMFSGKAVPEDQQGLWTYVMPRLALQSAPLLQAMLALASLQMARLEGDSILLSLKYYHVALRRVAKAVGQPSKRSGIDTLAATLLLGYYEVASAEHKKWNSHLLGARQLLMETDFLGKSKRIKKMKAQADARRRQDAFNGYSSGSFGSVEKYLGFEREIDENLVHDLAGFPPAYADNNDAILDSDFLEDDLTAKDIEDYDIRRDLLWWFLKQDAIQSMVSSNRLLLSFSRWSHCPPRAPMDRVDAPYGTFDHLVLLIGRITDFGARDVARKRKAVEAGGGVWRPSPGMDLGQPRPLQGPTSGQSPDSQRPSPRAQQQWPNMPPPMKGMMPDPPPSKLPRGFSGDASSSPSSNQEDLDLEAATAEAEFEWSSIKVALKTFESRLGPDFGPLPAEETQTVVTPFGLARHYRSYAISVIWLWYYIAQIIHRRFHPSMPPAAMMAAGVAAKQTAQIANEIALTVGGLMPESDMDASSTLALGAALMDATLALFFAGVQFQDAAQRAWTISSLRAISQRMGWGSSDTIASGCERSWETAAQMGRGPPYIRTMDPWAKDDRVAGRPLNSAAPVTDDNDRRFIPVNAGARVHWAVGILGIEDEVGKLTV